MTARAATRAKPRKGRAFSAGAALLGWTMLGWALLGLTAPAPAWAEPERGLLVSGSIYYRSQSIAGGNGAVRGSRLVSNLILGYRSGALFAGVLSGMEDDRFRNVKQRSFGPSAGLLSETVDLILTYHAAAERKTPGRTLSDGTGWQFDLAKRFQLTPSFGLGPRLSFRRLAYEKEEVNGVTTPLPQPVEVKDFQPLFAFVLFF